MIRLAAAFLLTATALAAQQPDAVAALNGRVVSGGKPVAGVEVSFRGMQRSITTDSAGRFRVAAMLPGHYEIVLRRLGYAQRVDTVTLVGHTETDREFEIEPIVTQLDTVRTSADEVQYFTPRLKEFEARRKRNIGGHFLPEAELRKLESVAMPSILRRFPGINIVQYNGQSFVRTRGVGSGSTQGDPPLDPRPGSPRGCWATIYLDGALIFDISLMTSALSPKPPDVGQFFAMNLSGIEYYPSAGTTPLQYKPARSNCGTILFWTRGH